MAKQLSFSEEARKKVWERDNATCRICKERFNHSQKTFEVHHVKPFRHREFRTKINNLILVCNKCHNWIHSKQNKKSRFLYDYPQV